MSASKWGCMRITLLLIVLFCLRPNVAQCGLIFAPLVTDSLALTGSFLASSPSFDTNFSQETNKGPIEFGAEGEVNAFLQRTPAANGTPRDGTLTYVVNRDF